MVRINPEPRFELSPYLYMQFMEPLGITDSSVEAGWNFQKDCWRSDFVEVTKELAPTLIRWGGCLSSYYRWREGVGPRDKRVPMLNLCWGGVETNQIGTHEFVDFCRQVGADPLMAVNFEADGRKEWMNHPKAGVRSAGPEEAVEWVDYCNNPSNEERKRNGSPEPLNIKLWQIGNETSYDPEGYDCETAAKRTLVFAKEMRKADPGIELIGWGDSGWAKRMLDIAGDELQYLAFHPHMDVSFANSPLNDREFRRDPELTWQHFMNAYKYIDMRIGEMREQMAGSPVKLAITESHFALHGRNRCDALSTWAAGVADARVLNVHARNGDLLKIATLADFSGTRWMVNAVMTPPGFSYLMPVAHVMALFRKHLGEKSVDVTNSPCGLDITASRTGDKVFLHVVNTGRTSPVRTKLAVDGYKISGGKIFQIAADPMYEVMDSAEILKPSEHTVPASGTWIFPAASVSAVELDLVK